MIPSTQELLADWDFVNPTTIRSKNTDFETEIGDVLQPDFYPQFKLKRWNNEFNFSIRPVLPGYAYDQMATQGNEVRVRYGNIGFRFRIDPPEIDQALDYPRGLNFETILFSAPLTNTIDFTVNTKGAVFGLQLPLTPQQIVAGNNRPAHAEYSIAIYAAKRHNQYETGKLAHLYRPRVIENNGTRSWGRWSVISQSLIQLSFAPALLLSGAYPIRIR